MDIIFCICGIGAICFGVLDARYMEKILTKEEIRHSVKDMVLFAMGWLIAGIIKLMMVIL